MFLEHMDEKLSKHNHYTSRKVGRCDNYHKVSDIRHTKSQNLNDSHLILQLFLPNSLKSGVKSRMKM